MPGTLPGGPTQECLNLLRVKKTRTLSKLSYTSKLSQAACFSGKKGDSRLY